VQKFRNITWLAQSRLRAVLGARLARHELGTIGKIDGRQEMNEWWDDKYT
jgi:hypothetical protein